MYRSGRMDHTGFGPNHSNASEEEAGSREETACPARPSTSVTFPLFRYLLRCPWESSQYLLRKMVSVLKKPVYMTLPSTAHRVRVPSKRSRNSATRTHHRPQQQPVEPRVFHRSHHPQSADFRVYDDTDDDQLPSNWQEDEDNDDSVSVTDWDDYDDLSTDESSARTNSCDDSVAAKRSRSRSSSKRCEFELRTVSHNFADFHLTRQIGVNRHEKCFVEPSYAIECSVKRDLLKERRLNLGRDDVDKIFCAEWLTDCSVVFGTKCNKLMVYNTRTRKTELIPSLERPPIPHCKSRLRKQARWCSPSSRKKRGLESRALEILNSQTSPQTASLSVGVEEDASQSTKSGGIHTVRINKSGTLLTTSAANFSDVAVYSLPTFDPVFVGAGAHSELIFDATWISEQAFVTGARDSYLAVWRVSNRDLADVPQQKMQKEMRVTDSNSEDDSDEDEDDDIQTGNGRVKLRLPMLWKRCALGEKVRALGLNPKYSEVAAVTMNAYIHVFDCSTFKQKYSKGLPFGSENTCMAVNEPKDFYAVGSKSHVTFIDSRTLNSVKNFRSPIYDCGIRSLTFHGNLLTIGTGVGHIYFYDIRADAYLESLTGQAASLTGTNGIPAIDPLSAADVFYNQESSNIGEMSPMSVIECRPAIYTHCYDYSGTRLFAAGGPLPVTTRGCYASIWQ